MAQQIVEVLSGPIWISNTMAVCFRTEPSSVANMVTFGRTTIPIGCYDYCQRYADRCGRPASGQIVELTRELWNDIIQTNNDVNTSVAPLTDNEIFRVEERWEYPKNVGDCEDYALEKRKRLNQRGIPLGALSMTVGRNANGSRHAVLTVITDRGDFVLDNVEQRVLLWKYAELYFLKRQSQHDPNTWVSLVSGFLARNQAGEDDHDEP